MFNRTGYVLCGFLCLIFLFAYGQSYSQLDNWQKYFYKGTISAGNHCRVRLASLDSPSWQEAGQKDLTAWQDIVVPHSDVVLPQPKINGVWRKILYECQVTLTQPAPGLVYLHTGWVFGKKIRIGINGSTRLDLVVDDAHKPIVPLRVDDLTQQPLIITVEAIAKAGNQIGLVGAAAMVLAPAEMVHNRLLSIEVSLQTVRYLYTLIPVLILGLVLVYGWARGIRSRMMLNTLFFFTLAALKNVLFVFADLWPWNIALTYVIAQPFTTATGLTLWLLIAEGFGLWARSILIPMAGICLFLLMSFALMFMSTDVYALSGPLNYFQILLIACGAIVGFSAFRQKLTYTSNNTWSRSYFFVLASLAIAFWLVTILDLGFYVFSMPIRMGYKFEYILPLVVGYALIQNLLQISLKYESERKAREKIESDLQTAREIQDSLAPPENSTLSDRFDVRCYQVKHDTVAGDWMDIRTTSKGVLGIMADATGKGVQAALVIHALQSLWAAELDHDDFDVMHWLQKVNHTLITLGRKRPHSMTVGVFSLSGTELTYWSAGHLPLYVITGRDDRYEVSALNARGSVIGIVEELSLRPEVMAIDKLGPFSLLLGTDGVFDKGTRSGRRAIVKLFQAIEAEGEAALRKIPTADDRTVILLKCQNAA